MASICSLSSQLLSTLSSSDPIQKPNSKKIKRRCHKKILALRRGNSSGRLVDENMIVLRKRIHEVKMVQTNYEPPREWMDWEKRIYVEEYDSMICDAMGHLQSYLLETRPSLALGMIALIALSVPTSTAVIIFNLMQMTNRFLSGIHLS